MSGDTRTITSNALPNHATGQFPNKGNSNTISAQSRKWVLPLTPEFTGEYHYHGVSQNLVDFSDQGNDLVHIGFAADGFLIMYSKGDVYKPSYQLKTEPRTGTNCVYRNPYTNQKIDIDGTVSDGTYVSDWEFVEGVDDLDSCDGISVDGQYVYIASEQYPYIGRCVNGKVTSQKKGKRRGPPPGGDHSGRRLPPPNRS